MGGTCCRAWVMLTQLGVGLSRLPAQQPAPGGEVLPPPRPAAKVEAPLPPAPIPVIPAERTVPITLPAALQLAELANLDNAQAREVVNQALAVQTRGRATALPNIQTGAYYNDHQG